MNNITQVNMIHQNSYHKFSQETSKATGNVTSSNSKDLNQLPYIKLPFPPTIRASDIAKKRIRSKICSKSPNAFFVYRKAFVDQLSNFTGKNKLKMTEVSRLVSSRWKMESKQVKLAYEEIAKQVEQELNNIRNKDLVYTDDFDIGRRKKKNNKRGRRSEFGFDAFFMNLKGNFNISTLDFSVKPNNNDDKNNSDNINSNCNSNFNSPSLSSSSSQFESSINEHREEESVNYEENNSSDELSIQEITNTFESNNNDNNDNIQQLQQNNYNLERLEEFPNYHSPISDKLICDDSNLLTPPNHGSELDTLYDNYNDYNVQYQQNEFHLYESFLKNNETPNYPSYPIFEDRGLDFYLGYFDNLS
ncbi:unnamed protein product [Rhizophagus irregularis]|nr:unnamed protein product [Rhizophagus irregularis]CAB5385150.1 unnamed protein product [Rhizophagus irregularis]